MIDENDNPGDESGNTMAMGYSNGNRGYTEIRPLLYIPIWQLIDLVAWRITRLNVIVFIQMLKNYVLAGWAVGNVQVLRYCGVETLR